MRVPDLALLLLSLSLLIFFLFFFPQGRVPGPPYVAWSFFLLLLRFALILVLSHLAHRGQATVTYMLDGQFQHEGAKNIHFKKQKITFLVLALTTLFDPLSLPYPASPRLCGPRWSDRSWRFAVDDRRSWYHGQHKSTSCYQSRSHSQH